MIVTFDESKNRRNIDERGLSFKLVEEFDFHAALFDFDNRRNYNEERVRAIGPIRGRIHVLVFTNTANGIRVISLRKANLREVKRYETEVKR